MSTTPTPQSPPKTNASDTAEKRALLARLVDEHGDSLYHRALRFFNNQEIAQEVIQETFLAATQAIDSFEGRSSHKTWLQGILRFKILDRLRQKKREQEESSLHQDTWTDDAPREDGLFNEHEHWLNETGPLIWTSDPESIAEQREFLETLQQCLKKFPEHIRQLFMLREIEGFTREELSAQFNLTSTNIGVILYRVRAGLQRCLQVNWYNDNKGSQKNDLL